MIVESQGLMRRRAHLDFAVTRPASAPAPMRHGLCLTVPTDELQAEGFL